MQQKIGLKKFIFITLLPTISGYFHHGNVVTAYYKVYQPKSFCYCPLYRAIFTGVCTLAIIVSLKGYCPLYRAIFTPAAPQSAPADPWAQVYVIAHYIGLFSQS